MTDRPSTPHAGGLTRERFARIRELFALANELSAGDRAALLDHECAGDGELRANIEELLEAGRAATGRFVPDDGGIARQLLGSSPTGPHEAIEVPREIGPYRIQRVIGRGGMGVVYLAEQSNPQREVALKILPSGPGAASLRSRFGREVRVLGRLEHPGIARIYEAGTTDTAAGSVSYFAMEFVRGLRLTDYAAKMALDTAARVELIAKVADAVQHAHTKGVIHRDLKPANILVSDEATVTDSGTHTRVGGAQPKILDFGVARLAEPDTQHTALTEKGLVIGTIAYMSPEQLSGDNDAVDARSDVYAMGVILYELLTGRMPHDIRSKPIAEAARIVRDESPSPLNAPGNTRVGRFDRDLETIVTHAMAHDRERRYATAAALAEDLRRLSRNEPILARPPTTTYQVSMFVRRHRGLVAGASAAAVALIAGTVTSSVLYAKARTAATTAAEEARKATEESKRANAENRLSTAVRDYMIHDLLMAASPGRMGYDVKMLDALSKLTEGLHERFAEQPEVEASIRSDLGDVLGNLGKLHESETQYKIAIPLLEQTAGKDDPRTIQALTSLSTTYQKLQRDKQWLKIATEALTRCRRALPVGHPRTVVALLQVGGALQTLGRSEEAITPLREGIELAMRDEQANGEAIGPLRNWLVVTEAALGHVEASIDVMRAEVDRVQKKYGPDSLGSIITRNNLINALNRADRAEEALPIAVSLVPSIDRYFAPGDPSRAHMYRTVAITYRRVDNFEEAERYATKAYDILATAFPEFNWHTENMIESLRLLYSQWPGHVEQHREWCMQSVKARLMLAHANELANLPDVLRKIESECIEMDPPFTAAACLDLIWQNRDRLAPPGHLRRAAFYANFARAGAGAKHVAHFQDAVQLAEASLPYATESDVAHELVSAAKAMSP